jgi:hypothetical protein
MSYGVGGIGISHADQGDLLDFIRFVAGTDLVSSEHRAAFLRLADPAVYKKSAGVYDQLRAAGVCASRQLDTDLKGEKFNHFNVSHDENYCTKYANTSLQASDWRVFRTWMRVALRTKPGQEWLLTQWMKDYWFKSLEKVPGGAGQIEEALVNVRVRNSFPAVADKAPARPASDPKGRIQRELDAYGAHSPKNPEPPLRDHAEAGRALPTFRGRTSAGYSMSASTVALLKGRLVALLSAILVHWRSPSLRVRAPDRCSLRQTADARASLRLFEQQEFAKEANMAIGCFGICRHPCTKRSNSTDLLQSLSLSKRSVIRSFLIEHSHVVKFDESKHRSVLVSIGFDGIMRACRFHLSFEEESTGRKSCGDSVVVGCASSHE